MTGAMPGVMVFVLVIGLSPAVCSANERITHTYPATLPIAAEAINRIERLPGAMAHVTYDRRGGKLIVLATADQHAAISAILEELNTAPLIIRVVFEIREGAQVTESGFTIEDTGDLSSGLEGDKARPGTDARRMASRTLRIPNGKNALLMVSREVPYIAWLMAFGIKNGHFSDEVVSRGIGAFLRVHARVIGDGAIIALKITPELRDPQAPLRRGLNFKRMATEFKIESGGVVSLGGTETRTEFYRKFLVGVDYRGKWRELIIRATPTIDDADADSPAENADHSPVGFSVPGSADPGSSKSQIKGK